MEFKKNIIYFYTVQKQLFIPIHRHEYNLRCYAIDLFETKKQEVKSINFNYTLYTQSIKKILKLHLKDFDSFRIIIIDGIYNFWSKLSIRSFSQAFYLKKYANEINLSYILLFSKKRSIFSQDVVYLYFPSGMFANKTIEILYISTGIDSKMFNTKHLITLGRGSCIKIIEHHKTLGKEKKIFSSMIDISQRAYSYLNFCKIKDNRNIHFLDITSIYQEDRSECNLDSFLFCGESIINFLSIFQIGKEIHSYINGFNICQGNIKYNSLIEHFFPNGKSMDIYKGIYDKLANTYFNSKIIILKSAKKTNANQHSKNILLDNPTNVNVNPKLEIFSEDVKCYHGCTIGQLIPQEIFYLQSRGLSKTEAINKLLFAFAKNILESIPCIRLKNLISKKINKNAFFNRN